MDTAENSMDFDHSQAGSREFWSEHNSAEGTFDGEREANSGNKLFSHSEASDAKGMLFCNSLCVLDWLHIF